ncbi:MAG: S41 family peptidase [Candidatus Pseudobacter hemicellulosilyticus]|uniref:S41 family peptidase n=1 Tax=Candidatus Pseudobacter hemicellulosilyticus TaxID=3121375 RepID=A0AAJ5WUM4_9BACT|nr:MAG: S41 family peptidase [Pseudobacter sp.]
MKLSLRHWNIVIGFGLLLFITGCAGSRTAFDPQRKYAPAILREDYTLFRNVLEESHPGLYWFSPKDTMDRYFQEGYQQLNDSLTEPEFRRLLSYVASRINCGHTTVKYSKKYSRYLDTLRQPIFPLSMKVWPDSMVVAANLNRRDSILRRGTVITAIDGHSTRQLTDTFFSLLSGDGHILTGKYQSLSNRGSFGGFYRTVYGLRDQFRIRYIDPTGNEQEVMTPVYNPPPDTPVKNITAQGNRKPEKEAPRPVILRGSRNIQLDTTLHSAYMTVNTFERGHTLKRFFRRSFRELQRRDMRYLVLDVRGNGGGDAGNSTLLTRYLADHRFILADSLYAVKRSSRYSQHIQWQSVFWMMTQFMTRKRSDGHYHFGYFEKHAFRPKKRHHFNGDIYILTGGNSFSATTLFAKVLKGQSNVKIVGEETGGGAYGNNAWMIPDVTLPNTRVRFRLPRFRMVVDKDLVAAGRGILPDIEVAATAESIRLGTDPKIDTVRQLILQKAGLVRVKQ